MPGIETTRPPSVRLVATFTGLYLGAAAFAAMGSGNKEFVLYIAVVVFMMAFVWVVHTRVHLTQGALWGLSMWGLAHMLGGLTPVPGSWPIHGDHQVLYSLWLIPGRLKYDQVVHAYGFGVTTWVCWQGLRSSLQSADGRSISPTVGRMVLACAAGLGFGALNEVIEFAATLLVPETNVGGYLNTGWDLVANLVGCVVVATLIYLFDRPAGRT
ncbi:MAG: DUF2238 domain-containing protein [Thermodesulfobacteriota bacterium]|nr:DUF2238 domain-containing protein [Thermodesulfobacteriota bacterium]